MRLSLFNLCTGVCAALAPALGAASPRTSSLSWVRLEGAESCISTQALARAVEERLHRKIFVSAAQGEVSVEGSIQRQRGRTGFKAILHIRDSSGLLTGTRELETQKSSCSSLDESLSLVIAVMIDPDAVLTEPVPPPPPIPEAAPPASVLQPDQSSTPPGLDPAPRQTALEATVSGAYGLLPGIGWGLSAGATFFLSNDWDLHWSATYWWTASAEVGRGARVEQRLITGAVGLCPLNIERGRWGASACPKIHLGWLRSSGLGFDVEQQASSLVALAGLEGRLRAGIMGPLAVQASLGVVVPLRRNRTVYSLSDGSSREAFQMTPLVLLGDLGLVVALP